MGDAGMVDCIEYQSIRCHSQLEGGQAVSPNSRSFSPVQTTWWVGLYSIWLGLIVNALAEKQPHLPRLQRYTHRAPAFSTEHGALLTSHGSSCQQR
ncbi:hypothetical protein BDW42DRAFT_158732 [Aspergillus taichungensis]|uniref:Uncharacterized protein n=1 Tax=Aspergillus taichungensis TaxID=482145 RepID=A0A2J5I9M2_9EURO|nr:hypothetical protein BDW42DRAFT_158732 [Aspergillus taichungensis]